MRANSGKRETGRRAAASMKENSCRALWRRKGEGATPRKIGGPLLPWRRGRGAEIHEVSARVLALLQRHGWNATSFQVLEPGFRYWFHGQEICVPDVDTGGAWVAAGAPLAPQESLAEAAEAFVAAARAAGRRVCFFAAEVRLVRVLDWSALLIGEQPVWSPADWAETLRASSSLREQLRRARAKGVTVRELRPGEWGSDTPLRAADRSADSSLARAASMAPLGFLVQVDSAPNAEKPACSWPSVRAR